MIGESASLKKAASSGKRPVYGALVDNPDIINGYLSSKPVQAQDVTPSDVLDLLESGFLKQIEKSFVYSSEEKLKAVICKMCRCHDKGIVFKKIKKNNFFTHPNDSRKKCEEHNCPCLKPGTVMSSIRIRTYPSLIVRKEGKKIALTARMRIKLVDGLPISPEEVVDKIVEYWNLEPQVEQEGGFTQLTIEPTHDLEKIQFKHTSDSSINYKIRIDGFSFTHEERNRLWGKETSPEEDRYVPLHTRKINDELRITDDIRKFNKILYVSSDICSRPGKHEHNPDSANQKHWGRMEASPETSEICLIHYGNICYASQTDDFQNHPEHSGLYQIILRELDLSKIESKPPRSKISIIYQHGDDIVLHNSNEIQVKISASKLTGYSDRKSSAIRSEVVTEEGSKENPEWDDVFFSEGIKPININLRSNQRFGLKVNGNAIIEIIDRETNQLLINFESRITSENEVKETSIKNLNKDVVDELTKKFQKEILSNLGWQIFSTKLSSLPAVYHDIVRQAIHSKDADEFSSSSISRKLGKIRDFIPLPEDQYNGGFKADNLTSSLESQMVFYKSEINSKDVSDEVPAKKNWGWKKPMMPKIILPHGVEYGMIFDHRPSHVLVNSEHDLDLESIIELNSGHRLIRASDAIELINRQSHQKIESLPALSIISKTPEEHISNLLSSSDWDEPSGMKGFRERSLFFMDTETDPRINSYGMRSHTYSGGWSDSNSNCIIVDGERYAVSRFISKDEEEDPHHIFWLRQMDSSGATKRRLILFDHKFPGRVPSGWYDYVNNSSNAVRIIRRYLPLKETIRAFFSLSMLNETNHFQRFSDAPRWACYASPWSIRRFFHTQGGGFSQLRKVDQELANSIDSDTAKSLWLSK